MTDLDDDDQEEVDLGWKIARQRPLLGSLEDAFAPAASCPCRGSSRESWEDKIEAGRGIIRTTCKLCGRWIGNRPVGR
jgi:hypothetical protein